MEICPTSAVAVAVRVAPLSMEACELEVMPSMLKRPPGTEMSLTVVVEDEAGCVDALADSLPRPRPLGDDWGVMESVRLWFPLVDSACTGGGTSFWGSVGGPPLHPGASSAVPMAPRSTVWDRDCASRFWKLAMEVASVMA